MSKTVSINKNDISRVMISELSPAETPFRFSFHDIYQRHKSSEDISRSINDEIRKFIPAFGNETKMLKPLKYFIRRSLLSWRELGVMHPFLLGEFSQFYKDYDQVLISLCNRSPISLRRPVRVASTFTQKTADWKMAGPALGKDKTSTNLLAENANSDQSSVSSYFAYERYTRMHAFLNSPELRGMELRFSRLKMVDISKCFHSIYTHSIGWAVKSKLQSKKDKADFCESFSDKFDSLMTKANYNETNGILIGPEISRIFAEVILQRIDLSVINSLKDKGYELDGKFSLKRYMDDYYVFTDAEEMEDIVTREIERFLGEYNLHLNVSKMRKMGRPFLTLRSVCVSAMSAAISDHYAKLPPGIDFVVNSERRHAGKLIDKLRGLALQYEQDLGDNGGYLLGILQRKIKRALSDVASSGDAEYAARVIFQAQVVMFFLVRHRPSYDAILILTEISLNLKREVNRVGPYHAETLMAFLEAEILDALVMLPHSSFAGRTELLNLLLVSRDVLSEISIKSSEVKSLLSVDNNQSGKMNYFDIVCVLYFIRDDQAYEEIANLIDDRCNEIILESGSALDSAEATMLYLDYVACPFVRKSRKFNLVRLVMEAAGLSPNPSKIGKRVKEIQDAKWFFSWDAKESTLKHLTKKKLSNAYS